MNIRSLVRPELSSLKPYIPDRYKNEVNGDIWLDSNENAMLGCWNRYPHPAQHLLRAKIGGMKGIAPNQIFISQGSDEAIDLIIRLFCTPFKDKISVISPGFGSYKHAATVSGIEVVEFEMEKPFDVSIEFSSRIFKEQTKILFLCSPNNPTGRSIEPEALGTIIQNWQGIVVLDEAYIDYSSEESWMSKIDQYPNLIVLQTLSKAWGMAALRIGITYASPWIINRLEAIKMPYNVSEASVKEALRGLDRRDEVSLAIAQTLRQKAWLEEQLAKLVSVDKIFPSEANFLFVQIQQASLLEKHLRQHRIFVRKRSEVSCDDCLRISVGTHLENEALISAIKVFEKQSKLQQKPSTI